jgi:hypothetical protein
MARRKYPSELNTRHVRVSLGDYALLKEISRRQGVTMAEALHLALERQEQVTRVSPAQIPMPVFQLRPSEPTIVVQPKGGVFREW